MITKKFTIREAVDKVLDGPCRGSIEAAIERTAKDLCLPVEAVRDAMQPNGHCCQKGENLGVSVCEDCAEDGWADFRAVMEQKITEALR